jgi:hypothetical protein
VNKVYVSIEGNDVVAKLDDCPFCGFPPRLENTVTEAVIRCSTCRVSMIQRHAPKDDAPGIERVIKRWNTRGHGF